MIIVMKESASAEQIGRVKNWAEALDFQVHLCRGGGQARFGLTGEGRRGSCLKTVESLPGVEKTLPISKPYKLASREFQKERTIITVGELPVGGGRLVVMAGPCSVESQEQLMECAFLVKKGGAHILRGGAFKPRSSPYSFQGLGEEGLALLKKAREKTGLPVITEVLSPEEVELVVSVADIIQIGARNIQNFSLLRKVGRTDKPVLLKRGMMTTIEELLMAAEYILAAGNHRVILCERGIRTFETATRNTLDLSAVPVLKELTHLPVIVDPSHASGNWRYVLPLSRAALACGADGIMVEVHHNPQEALCDGGQSLKPERFYRLMEELSLLETIVSRFKEDC